MLKFLTANCFIKSYQLIAICEAVKRMVGPENSAEALEYMCEVIVSLFSNVVDLENMHLVFRALHNRAHTFRKLIKERLGVLNVLNMHYADYLYDLDLRVHDEWKLTNLLTRLALKVCVCASLDMLSNKADADVHTPDPKV